MWYKEEDKEASKPAFLYTDTIRYDTITLNIIVELSEANVHAMELLLRTVTVPRSFPSKGDPANDLYSSPFHSDVQYLFQSSFSDYFMF